MVLSVPNVDFPGRVARRPDSRAGALLGLHVVSPSSARSDGRDPLPSGLGGRASDRRWQVAVLSGAGAGASGSGRGRVAPHLVDEGSGRHARRQRCSGSALQQHALRRREDRRVGGPPRGSIPSFVRLARAACRRGERWIPGTLVAMRRAVRRGRRGPLHQPVGARFPAGVSPAGPAAQRVSERQPPRVYRDGDSARPT